MSSSRTPTKLGSKNSSDFKLPVISVDPSKDYATNWTWAHKDTVGRFTCLLNGTRFENEGISCHNQIRLARYSDGVKSLITAIGNHSHQKEYLDYLTSSSGVFAQLFKHPGWELLEYEGRIFGLKVPDAAIDDKSYPFCLMYAFLIESRAFHEYPIRVDTWHELVKLGVEPKLAHVMSAYIPYDIKKNVFVKQFTARWDSLHKIFSDSDGQMDFSLFLRGGYISTTRDHDYTSMLWHRGASDACRKSLELDIPWSKFGSGKKVGSFAHQMSFVIKPEMIPALAEDVFNRIQKRK